MNQAQEVVILGGGIGGLATAFFLAAEPGMHVTLVEREPRHNAHSSGRSAEMLRSAIDDPVTEGLALTTSRLLRAPEEIGLQAYGPLIDDRGLFVITEEGSSAPWIERHLGAGEAVATHMDEFRRAAPHFEPMGTQAYRLPGGGHIQVDRLLATLARGAAARGVRFLRSYGDTAPVVDNGEVIAVQGRGHRIPCHQLIVAAGAWSGPIGRLLNAPLPLRTTRRHMWVTRAAHQVATNAPIVWDDAAGFYARPEPGPGQPRSGGTGFAFSSTDLEDYAVDGKASREGLYPIDADTRELALAAAARHLPTTDLTLVRSWRGLRDLSPDDRPFLGPDTRIKGLNWCAGLGGHGLTISLAAGRTTANAVAGRTTRLTELCSPNRFADQPI